MVVALALALALAVPVVAQEASSDPLRLDQKVVPTHQKVSLRIDPDSPKYDGVVVVDLNVSIATDTFRFHAEDMELQGVVLIDAAGASVGLSYEAGEANLVAVTCKRQLAPGQYTLSIEFANEFDTTSSGLYRVIYEKQGYLFTQFEDDDARKAFPCWDEPAFKIPWDMTLSCPESQLVIFNTPERSVTVEDGWRTVEYASTPPLPSYLLAMAAGARPDAPAWRRMQRASPRRSSGRSSAISIAGIPSRSSISSPFPSSGPAPWRIRAPSPFVTRFFCSIRTPSLCPI
jgi:aminopeptidase N